MEHLKDVEHPRIEVRPRVLSDLDKAYESFNVEF